MIFKGYISSRKILDGSVVQQKVQNLVIRDACEKKGYDYKLSFTEYGIKNCYLNYNEMLNDLRKDKFDGIAFYSLAQLPNKQSLRNNLYKILMEKQKSVLFALENILVKNLNDIKKLEELLKLKFFVSKNSKNIKIK